MEDDGDGDDGDGGQTEEGGAVQARDSAVEAAGVGVRSRLDGYSGHLYCPSKMINSYFIILKHHHNYRLGES